MFEGYHCSDDGGCSYSWLDELLCEYVDGTMDPAVRKSFEEYLAMNPALVEEVERLRCTRTLLCQHGCHIQAPNGLQNRIRRRLAAEMMHAPPTFFSLSAMRLGMVATFASATVIMLMVGMFVGATLSTEPEPEVAEESVPSIQPHWQQAGMTPLLGQRPARVPSLFKSSVLLPAMTLDYLRPERFIGSDSLLPVSALQRTDVAP